MITVTAPLGRTARRWPAVAVQGSSVDSTCLAPRVTTQVRDTDRDTELEGRRTC